MQYFRNRQSFGFTLVELALVLVVIGLLITGVLKGEALIQNAKIKKIVNQKESMTAAFYTFYDKYGLYPGDENLPNDPTNDTNNGDADGLIDYAEIGYVWQDMVLAGIINGNYTGAADSLPVNPFGSTMRIQYTGTPGGSTTALNGNCFIMNAIPYDVAAELDRKYDDSTYNTGNIRSNTAYTTQTNKIVYWRM